MSSHFHSLEIIRVHKETSNAISISFQIPENLKDTFNYLPGQYLTLKLKVKEEELRREYSICTSPLTNDFITVTSKRVDNGRVSNYLNDQIKVGDQIEVMAPAGSFTLKTNPQQSKHYFLFAGGSGITPIQSILKSALLAEEQSRVTLVYQNRTEDDIIFKQQLSQLANEYEDRLKVIHVLSSKEGRLTKEKVIDLIKNNLKPSENFEFFMCGPNGLMEVISDTLKGMGAPKERIHRELFTAPEKKSAAIVDAASETITTQNVTIILKQQEHKLEVEPNSTVLFSALDKNLDPPYSCQSGICSTCRAKLVSGKVVMDEREGLTDKEIEQGYVLTCQAHPLTDDVVLEFE